MAKPEDPQGLYGAEVSANGAPIQYTDAQIASALANFETKLLSALPANWDRTYASAGMIQSPETRDVFFLPSTPFRTGIITTQDVNNLLKNPDARMLSVGAGPAYFERFLVELGVSPSQIQLADIDSRFLPSGIPSTIFDMNGQWPAYNENPFDLIVFSQTFPTFMVMPATERQTRLIGILQSATPALAANGEIRMSGLTLGYPAPTPALFARVPSLSVRYDAQKQFLRATRVR